MYTLACLPSNKIPLRGHVESDQLMSELGDSKALFSLTCYLYHTAEWRLCLCFWLNPCVFSAQQVLLHICVSVFVKKKTVRITNGGIYWVSLCYSTCLCFWMRTYGAGDTRVWVCSCISALKASGAETWLITCLQSWKSFKLKQNGLISR